MLQFVSAAPDKMSHGAFTGGLVQRVVPPDRIIAPMRFILSGVFVAADNAQGERKPVRITVLTVDNSFAQR